MFSAYAQKEMKMKYFDGFQNFEYRNMNITNKGKRTNSILFEKSWGRLKKLKAS